MAKNYNRWGHLGSVTEAKNARKYPIVEGQYEGLVVSTVLVQNMNKVSVRIHKHDVDPRGPGWQDKCVWYSEPIGSKSDSPNATLGKLLRELGADIKAGWALRRFEEN